jgi:hypothetical protein
LGRLNDWVRIAGARSLDNLLSLLAQGADGKNKQNNNRQSGQPDQRELWPRSHGEKPKVASGYSRGNA